MTLYETITKEAQAHHGESAAYWEMLRAEGLDAWFVEDPERGLLNKYERPDEQWLAFEQAMEPENVSVGGVWHQTYPLGQRPRPFAYSRLTHRDRAGLVESCLTLLGCDMDPDEARHQADRLFDDPRTGLPAFEFDQQARLAYAHTVLYVVRQAVEAGLAYPEEVVGAGRAWALWQRGLRTAAERTRTADIDRQLDGAVKGHD